jgi:hypothetical protein
MQSFCCCQFCRAKQVCAQPAWRAQDEMHFVRGIVLVFFIEDLETTTAAVPCVML